MTRPSAALRMMWLSVVTRACAETLRTFPSESLFPFCLSIYNLGFKRYKLLARDILKSLPFKVFSCNILYCRNKAIVIRESHDRGDRPNRVTKLFLGETR
jgi:hypothetical protein